MALNLEMLGQANTVAPLAGSAASERLNRQAAEARQAQWMLELERAMLANAAKKPSNSGKNERLEERNSSPEGKGDDLAGAFGAKSPAQLHASEPSASGQGDAGSATSKLASSELDHSANAASAAQTARQTYAAYQGDAQAMEKSVAAAQVASAAGNTQSASVGNLANLTTNGNLSSLSGVSTVALGNIGKASANSSLQQSHNQINSLLPAQAKMSTLGLGLMQSQANPQADLQADLTALGEAEVTDTDQLAAQSKFAENEELQYPKQFLHVYQGKDGVHAFVRDAQLSSPQILSLAQNMAGEFAAQGQLLASLTVNGKKVSGAERNASVASVASVAAASLPSLFEPNMSSAQPKHGSEPEENEL